MPFALVRPSPPPPLSSCPSHEQAHAIHQLLSGKSPMRQCANTLSESSVSFSALSDLLPLNPEKNHGH